MKKYAIIVAGGSGTRMGGGIPKQFRTLAMRPVLWWSMKAFHDEDPSTSIILVLPQDFISFWKDFFLTLPQEDRFPYEIAAGGSTRTDSVRNGLKLIDVTETQGAAEDPEQKILVAVHDGARPMVTRRIISEGWAAAARNDAAIPVVAVTDSLRQKEGEESHSVDRNLFVAVQTPQVFDARKLTRAYDIAGEKSFTDDAAVMEAAGHKISLFDGDPSNIKVTNPKDLAIAEVLMK